MLKLVKTVRESNAENHAKENHAVLLIFMHFYFFAISNAFTKFVLNFFNTAKRFVLLNRFFKTL